MDAGYIRSPGEHRPPGPVRCFGCFCLGPQAQAEACLGKCCFLPVLRGGRADEEEYGVITPCDDEAARIDEAQHFFRSASIKGAPGARARNEEDDPDEERERFTE